MAIMSSTQHTRLKFHFKNGTLCDRIKYFSIREAIIYLPYKYTGYDDQCTVQVILTMTIRLGMRYDSFMGNKNNCASHPQVYPACYHFRNSNIAVVVTDIRSCTTYITGHANDMLSFSLHQLLILTLTYTAVLGAISLPAAAVVH